MFGWLRRFGEDERGNVMFITAFAAMPLLLISFGALDVVDGMSVRQNLQRASDEAVLAATAKYRSKSREQRKEARRFFLANLNGRKRYRSVKSKLTSTRVRGKYVMEYTLQAKVEKLFAGFSEEQLHTINIKSSAEIDTRAKTPPRLIDPDKYKVFQKQDSQ